MILAVLKGVKRTQIVPVVRPVTMMTPWCTTRAQDSEKVIITQFIVSTRMLHIFLTLLLDT